MPSLRMGELQGARDPPRAQGAAARARILAVLPRARSRIQPCVQFLRRHERRGHCPLSEGGGHRASPDLKMGMNGGRPTSRSHSSRLHPEFAGADDPFGVFRELGGLAGARRASERRLSEFRPARNAQRKALDALGLEADASAQEVKTRFKALVKRHHPDANGGDRSSEDRLREIIQAYNYLKS